MLRRALTLTLLLTAAGASAQTPAPTPQAPGLTLTAAIERALGANQTIAAARLQRPVDAANLGVASERPNPEVLYELSKETPRQALGVTLPIELGGKRQRRIDVANATVAVSDAD